MIKKCTKCDIKYPATREYFYQEKRNKNGLQAQCKVCMNAAGAFWREKVGSQYHREHYQKNKEKYYKSCQKYRKTFMGYVVQLVDNIKSRCANKKSPKYKHYGGRGIQCCFTTNELYNWVIINKIDPRGFEIHRIDNDGNYTLDNIEFLDRPEHVKRHYELEPEKDEFGFKGKKDV